MNNIIPTNQWSTGKSFLKKLNNSNETYQATFKLCIHKFNRYILTELKIFSNYNQTNPFHYYTGVAIILFLLVLTDAIVAIRFNFVFKLYLPILFCIGIPLIFTVVNSLASLILSTRPGQKFVIHAENDSKTCKVNFIISMIISILSANMLLANFFYDFCRFYFQIGYPSVISICDLDQPFIFLAVFISAITKYSATFLWAINKFKIENAFK